MIKKIVTKAVFAANIANAKKSTGPRTAAGKLKASRNAIAHGFFAKELVLNDEERKHWENVRRSLRAQLAPETVLQDLQFAVIMAWIGYCISGQRLDMRCISRLLGQDSSPQVEPEQTGGTGARIEWYLSSKQELRTGIRLLRQIQQEFLRLGRIEEKWYVPLDKAFGPQLRELLTQWTPSNSSAVMLAHHLVRHAEIFRRPLPPPDQEEGGNKTEVVLDPEQSKQMVAKLFQVQESLLSDLWRSAEQRALSAVREQNVASDPPRHFSAACRNLDRAVERFRYLKENKL
jgi:hypothetical protein